MKNHTRTQAEVKPTTSKPEEAVHRRRVGARPAERPRQVFIQPGVDALDVVQVQAHR